MNNLKPIFLTCLLTMVSMFSFAQNQWHSLPDIGFQHDTTYRIEDIYFTDTLNGVAVMPDNRIFKTNDGGIHWKLTNDTFNSNAYCSVEFLDDKKTGIVGGVSSRQSIQATDSGTHGQT